MKLGAAFGVSGSLVLLVAAAGVWYAYKKRGGIR